MFSKIERVYRTGEADINEDAYVKNDQDALFAVIDGATGLGRLSGSLASSTLKAALEGETGSLLERILKGNTSLGKKAVELTREMDVVSDIEEIVKIHRSSCALAAIQIFHSQDEGLKKLEYVTSGDCILFLQLKTGQIRQVNFDYLDFLDGKALQQAVDYWGTVLNEQENPNNWEHDKIYQTRKEIRTVITPILQQNRNKLNTCDGYGIIDGSKKAEEYLEIGSIPLVNVKKILLLSDGLKIHSPRGKSIENEWAYSARLAFDYGLSYLEKVIVDMEEKDPACYDYPRLKGSDDKTGILLHLD